MSPERSAPFRELGRAFAAGGDRYERLRPGYPDPAVSWLVEGTAAGAPVVDVGAGTGKLSTALAARGFDVVAVDPSVDMLAQLSRSAPQVRTHVGTGEVTGLPGASAALVTFAQSWHWVEPVAGSVETARLLTPGGRAGWVWNFMDVREPWVAELAAIWHTVGGEEATNPARQSPVLGADFGPVTSTTVDWVQPVPVADLAELVRTRSYYLSASATDREMIDAEVAAFLAARFPRQDVVELPYRTHCFRASLA